MLLCSSVQTLHCGIDIYGCGATLLLPLLPSSLPPPPSLQGIPATVEGMLGGYSRHSTLDITGSKKFLLPLIQVGTHTPVGSHSLWQGSSALVSSSEQLMLRWWYLFKWCMCVHVKHLYQGESYPKIKYLDPSVSLTLHITNYNHSITDYKDQQTGNVHVL